MSSPELPPENHPTMHTTLERMSQFAVVTTSSFIPSWIALRSVEQLAEASMPPVARTLSVLITGGYMLQRVVGQALATRPRPSN